MSGLKLVIEHLVNSLPGRAREHRHTAPVLQTYPEGVDPGWSRCGLIQGQPLKGSYVLSSGCFVGEECCMARELLHKLGEFCSPSYV